MKLLKIIERPIKSFGKPGLANEFHIKNPTDFEFEQAKTYCHLNGLDTIVIYY